MECGGKVYGTHGDEALAVSDDLSSSLLRMKGSLLWIHKTPVTTQPRNCMYTHMTGIRFHIDILSDQNYYIYHEAFFDQPCISC